MNESISKLCNAILEGDVVGAKEGVQTSLDAGLEPGNILAEGMIAAMREVGRRIEEGEYYVPEMLISARAMHAGIREGCWVTVHQPDHASLSRAEK